MEFTCAHCGKLIGCSAILIDNTFLHSTCEGAYNESKENKEEDSEILEPTE